MKHAQARSLFDNSLLTIPNSMREAAKLVHNLTMAWIASAELGAKSSLCRRRFQSIFRDDFRVRRNRGCVQVHRRGRLHDVTSSSTIEMNLRLVLVFEQPMDDHHDVDDYNGDDDEEEEDDDDVDHDEDDEMIMMMMVMTVMMCWYVIVPMTDSN